MADEWDAFPDAPQQAEADPWTQFPDAQQEPSPEPPSRWDRIKEGVGLGVKAAVNGKAAIGGLDAALAMGTGMLGTAAGGVAGMVSAPFVGMDKAADITRGTQEALSYQPRSEIGKVATAGIAYPFEKLAQAGDWTGQKAADATGSPAVGAVVNTAIQGIPALLARRATVPRYGGSGAPRPSPSVPARAPQAPRAAAPQAGRNARLAGVPEKPAAPTLEQLQKAKNDAYKAAEETGVVVSRGAINRLKVELVDELKKEGLNKTLHPKTSAALKEIVDTKGQLSLSQLETLRKIANDAKGAIEPADARLGARIVERIDDFEDGLAAADVVSGDAAAASAFKEARALNQRYAKARTIQKMFDDAEVQAGANFTQSGMENALRQQFKALAKNDRKLRGFTEAERAAIRKVAVGGPMENALRMIGKFAPTGGVSGPLGVILGASGFGFIPAAGMAGRVAATRMTVRNANRVSEMVRAGPQKPVSPRKAMATAEQ